MPEFEEGKSYELHVKNKLHLPDGNYFILESESHKQFLLNALIYECYNIEVGKTITCIVDKINCSGKIFFEPPHPQYKIGDIDKFTVLQSAIRKSRKTGEEFPIFEVFNSKTNKAIIPKQNAELFNNISIGETVECEIYRISKGELRLIRI